MFFNQKIRNWFSNDIGIDLGTANTLIHVRDQGVILREPSVVAVKVGTKTVLAVGNEAKKMIGRTPSDIVAIRPMRDGVIADFYIVQEMIKHLINKIKPKKFTRPRMVIGIPSGITEVERRAVKEAAEKAGAREIYLIEESFSAAIGANIPIHEPIGNMIIDIGGGTTEVSIISLGGLVLSQSIRVGGNKFDETLIQYMKKKHNIIIGERTAEEVKVQIGNAYMKNSNSNKVIQIRGRDNINGLPKVIDMDSYEIQFCFKDNLNEILNLIRETLDKTPPELAADIHEQGIIMTGGGALLKGLPQFISKSTGLPITLANSPLDCVVLGTAKFLEQIDKFNYRNIY